MLCSRRGRSLHGVARFVLLGDDPRGRHDNHSEVPQESLAIQIEERSEDNLEGIYGTVHWAAVTDQRRLHSSSHVRPEVIMVKSKQPFIADLALLLLFIMAARSHAIVLDSHARTEINKQNWRLANI